MTASVDQSGQKWVQVAIALVSVLLGYIFYTFINQINVWFTLESFIPKFSFVSQAVSILVAVISFVVIYKNDKAMSYLSDVYSECLKIVFPDKEITNKQTIIVIIGVTVIGFVLGMFDWLGATILSFLK